MQRKVERMAEIRERICFHGRVQGVGFRYTALHLARSLGLTGWVRNEYDGTVTVEVQGSRAMIDKMLERLNCGTYIRIDWMDTKELPTEEERGFSVRY